MLTDAELRRVARRLGLRLSQPELLRQALHVPTSGRAADPLRAAKERLEYLGDSVIGFVVADHLFSDLPEADEGVLSAVRAAVVSAPALAAIAEQLGLPEALGLERAPAGRGRARLLAATLEAVVGALYRDGGLEAASDWIGPPLFARGAEVLEHGYLPPKSRLQERTQRRGHGTPTYRVVGEHGAEHERTFDVEVLVDGESWGHGSGPSRRAAEQTAAEQALKRLS